MNTDQKNRCVPWLAVLLAWLPSAVSAAPVVLFDGTGLTGWHQAGPGGFELHDGVLTAHGGMGLLWNDRPLANFAAHVEYRVTKPSDNSGVFVRFPDPGTDPWVAVNQGHEVQICDTEPHNHTGAIYNFHDSSAIPTRPVGQWNDLDITVVGRHYTVAVNGQAVNDFTSTRAERGFLGLQNHWDAVSFRKVVVTELPGPAAAESVGPPVPTVDAAAGLVGRYFDDVHAIEGVATVKRPPFFVRVDPRVDFVKTSGDFYGSHLSENFGVRWTGAIHVEAAGPYTFDLASDDGAVLSINGHAVLDDGGRHEMADKAATVLLPAAGNYPVRLDYQQALGDEGCVLKWQPPGAAKLVTVPAAALVHARADEAVTWDRTAWTEAAVHHRQYVKAHGRPWERMDYGPFLSGTFDADEPKGNTTLKGVIVSLDADQTTNVLFDTELLRYSAGWTGDFINFNGVAYDGRHGRTPRVAGTQVFGTPAMPGCSHDGSWKDPRPVPYGPLPREWGHYRGLYRCGDQVVFSYTVNGVGVLDMPGTVAPRHSEPQLNQVHGGIATAADVPRLFTRTLEVDATPKTLSIVVCQAPPGASLIPVAASDGVRVTTDVSGLTIAELPVSEQSAHYTITIGSSRMVLPDSLNQNHDSFRGEVSFGELTHGGPRRWGEPVVTQGRLGDAAGPYAVDTLTLPERTPFNAWMRTSGFDFFPDGKSAAVCTWNGDVWVVKGIDDKLDHLSWQRFATGLFQPLGLKIVNGEVYVLGRDQITRLHDLNGDGEADWYENFNNDCQVAPYFHEFQHDLQTDSHGNFYYAKGGGVNAGGDGFQTPLTDDNGCILKVTPDGQHLSVVATGLRAPNGTSMGPGDRMTVSDNQGTWTPACRLSFVTPGAFLGVPTNSHLSPPPTNYGNPICWFPYVDGDYTTGDNSSGGAAWDTSAKWGPFDGQLIHLSYGTCSIFDVMMEQVDGVWQGGVCRFPLDFDSGIMRARFNPGDGQLYVAGLKGWQTRAAKDGTFQRVRYTGRPVRMPVDLHVQHDGLAITFAGPLDRASATDPENYAVEQWNYIWSGAYGSPDVSRDDPKKRGHDTVDVDAATLSADGRTVVLKMADLKPVMQMKVIVKVKGADGTPMDWEIDNTVNKVPGVAGSIATTQPGGRL